MHHMVVNSIDLFPSGMLSSRNILPNAELDQNIYTFLHSTLNCPTLSLSLNCLLLNKWSRQFIFSHSSCLWTFKMSLSRNKPVLLNLSQRCLYSAYWLGLVLNVITLDLWWCPSPVTDSKDTLWHLLISNATRFFSFSLFLLWNVKGEIQ